jgi:ABC-type nickel/cobalt efflux system permease component RcnA
MSKLFLTYFILVLMVFQSTAGTVDAHQSHQSGTEHLTFNDHQHTQANVGTDHYDTETSKDHEKDCHHCCHCHGHSSPAALIKPLSLALNKSPVFISNYRESFSSEIINPLLRPPLTLV